MIYWNFLHFAASFSGPVLSAFYLVFENKGLIGGIRAWSLKNKELVYLPLRAQVCRLRGLRIVDCGGLQRSEVRLQRYGPRFMAVMRLQRVHLEANNGRTKYFLEYTYVRINMCRRPGERRSFRFRGQSQWGCRPGWDCELGLRLVRLRRRLRSFTITF